MFTKRRFLSLACLVLASTFVSPLCADEAPKKDAKPQVEVVFVLDTTGSMSGLIQAAKQKVWAISNQIASGKPTPQLKIGLVAYRDRGDEYVTKVTDLTGDLDEIHGQLMKFSANGGGDGPESVNKALEDAVTKIKWSDDKKTLRIIFLVGDAPPHMDYKGEAQYPEICKKAVTKGLIINTIQCGGDPNTTKFWKDICAKSEGSYAPIPQSGGAVAIATPFDAKLAEINTKLARSTVVYGSRRMRELSKSKVEAASSLPAAPAADRAAFAGKSGSVARYDLLDALKEGRVKLDEVKDEELPEEFRKLSKEERKSHLAKLEKERKQLSAEAVELDKKRQAFILKKLDEKKKNEGKDSKDSFDNQVLEMLRKQAKKSGVDY